MNNSIQYFLENGIPGLEKIKKDFFTDLVCFDGYIEKVKGIVLDFGCHIISEVLEEWWWHAQACTVSEGEKN